MTGVLFYPREIYDAVVPDLPGGRVERIEVGEDRLGAYFYSPHEGAPVLLFFHGNGEVMTDYFFEYHAFIADLGMNFLVVDYRGYGLSTGFPTLSRLLEDARAALDHAVGKMGIAPSDLVIMGRSLGSLAALEVASGAGRNARGLVLESGIARFDSWVDRMGFALEAQGVDMDAVQSALGAHFDQEKKIKSFEGPVLVMHAPHDEIVPVQNGKWFGEWGAPERTTTHIFPRGGHNDIHFVNREEYFRVLGEFFAKLNGEGG